MRSFSLLRTNVGLTTNVKIIIDTNYNLFLESINSSFKLESTKLKKVRFNKNNYFDELIPFFFKGITKDDAYKIKNNDSDSYTMNSDFSTQFDNLYVAGARNITDNKSYTEEFEYFAPLYIFRNQLPKYFAIFRIDGAGINPVDSTNFKTDFLNKFKIIKLFDLTRNTAFGEWLDNNFVNNPSFPDASLDVDFRDLEFTKWIGISFKNGGYTSKSRYLDKYFSSEQEIYEFEKFIFDGYSSTEIIHPHILNLSFLFDDTPATPTSLRKWSINRYSGFYLDDLEFVDGFTLYNLPELRSNVEILEGNILYSPSGSPFVDSTVSNQTLWVELEGQLYKVELYEEAQSNVLTNLRRRNDSRNIRQSSRATNRVRTVQNEIYGDVYVIKYKIISPRSLQGKQALLNKRFYYINASNQILKISDQTPLVIDTWDKADVYIIEVDGLLHNVVKIDGVLTLVTDYAFEFTEKSKFNYGINNKDERFFRELNLTITPTNEPKRFAIYRAKFTDIKDFDTQVVDNEYSRYEYETEQISDFTGEPKLLVTDFRVVTNPSTFEQFRVKKITQEVQRGSNPASRSIDTLSSRTIPPSFRSSTENTSLFQVVNIPCSSDYTANLETFRLDNTNLTSLWSKNSQYARFGYQKSISKSNVPYLLNNNSVHEVFNRCANTFESIPKRISRNLDYFYSINSGNLGYTYHSLHIEKNDFYTYSVGTNSINRVFVQDQTFRFEVDKYLNVFKYGTNSATYSYDYFSYFFEIPNYFTMGKIKSNVRRYSYFEQSDGTIPNITLFNGLKFLLYEVDSINFVGNQLENINLRTTNKFSDYKFSILLSKNLKYIDDNSKLQNVVNWGTFSHYQTQGSYIAFRTSESATPSNIDVGDKIEVTFKPPHFRYSGWYDVTSIGILSGGGYGFVTSATSSFGFTQSYPGLYEINFKWKKIKEWTPRSLYYTGDVIMWEGILYNVLKNTKDFGKDEINKEPWELTSWFSLYELDYPFWKPVEYSTGEWCYRQGDFYFRNDNIEGVDFWKPEPVYQSQQVVLHKGNYYMNVAQSNQSRTPKERTRIIDLSETTAKDWEQVPKVQESKWSKVQLWVEDTLYEQDQYVVLNKILYKCNEDTEIGDLPGVSSRWTRIYSFVPDTDIVYSPSVNPILMFSDDYYICESNPGFTLDNGITIYINEKHRNVLVNIAINDNTSNFLQGCSRDLLYSDFNSRLTAANFIKQINTIDAKFGFIDYLSYVVIKEDGSYKKYNFDTNFSELPYFLQVEYPDQLEIKSRNLAYSPSFENLSSIRPLKTLENGEIETRDEIDHYSGIPIAYRIGVYTSKKERPTINNIKSDVDKIQSSKNSKVISKSPNSTEVETYYRHSGYYMPVFYEIELFKSSDEFDISGNYIFDTSLTLFGIMRQRIISKRSRNGNILKLQPFDGVKSVYPMLDEFGLTFVDHFIFKSSWDSEYHFECKRANTTSNQQVRPRSANNSNILVRSIDQRTPSRTNQNNSLTDSQSSQSTSQSS